MSINTCLVTTMQLITIRLIPLQLDDLDELTEDFLMTLQATKTMKIIQSCMQPGSLLPKADYTTWDTLGKNYQLNPTYEGRHVRLTSAADHVTVLGNVS